MPPGSYLSATSSWVFLIALASLVHAPNGDRALAQKPQARQERAVAAQKPAAAEILTDIEALPAPVREMREAILSAVRAGQIEELRTALELNELKPSFGDGPLPDPIAHLKQISADGEGCEILAAIANVLSAGFVALPLGKDLENNRVYVWPHFAETGVANLSPAREVELLRLVSVAAAKDMKAAGKYTYWRLGIGADGTWHFLLK